MPRALVVFNPAASRALSESDLAAACHPLEEFGWTLELRATACSGMASLLAREAVAAGYEMVVAAGGDGTVNEIVQGLAHGGTALGVLPLGMVNLWAAELGLPTSPAEAARALAAGSIRPVDLGVIDWGDGRQRYFLLMAGIGFDAAVVQRTGARLKRLLGPLAFILSGIRTALGHYGATLEISLPSGAIRAESVLLLVGNTRLYAGRTQVTPHARADDGLLDLCLLPGRGFRKASLYFAEIVAGRHLDNGKVKYLKVRSVTVRATPAVPVQIDGELAGKTPVDVRVAPRALRVVVPAGSHPPVLDAD